MVKHIILWQLKDELSLQEKELVKKEMKDGLEGLKGKGPGLIDIHVQISALESSNAEVMLDVTLEDAAEADRIVTILMGDKTEPRKEYIAEHANFNKKDRFMELEVKKNA